MLANALYAPVSLGCVFDEADLTGLGIEIDSHITVLYAAGKTIEKKTVLSDIEAVLGPEEFNTFMELLEDTNNMDSVLDHFKLDIFENDSDFIILKLLESSPIYESLVLINKAFRAKYGVSAEFTYTPHMTLAVLKSGMGKKYLESEKLESVLRSSKVIYEDLIISYGTSSELTDREKHGITTFHAVTRYFREEDLRKELKELK